MNSLLEIPELVALAGNSSLIRIPNQIDVPVTDRVLRIIDTPPFQRLKRISQLGLVSFVYPAANHSRFEHSLGVYRNALLFLRQLANDDRFCRHVTGRDIELLIVAALLHDVGHWPYCHPIEDLNLSDIPSHEDHGRKFLADPTLVDCLQQDWQISVNEVIDLINKRTTTPTDKILNSILSGPIDIDKMDYLYRDSLHAGVPYGQNFDAPRLIRSLTMNQAQNGLAITHKGKTAAELMVFARYVMFSEVYWHHAVRSATAMFQRAFYLWHQQRRSTSSEAEFSQVLDRLFDQSEPDFIHTLKSDQNCPQASELLNNLFGTSRRLFKRLTSFSYFDQQEIYSKVAHRPYPWIVACSQKVAEELSQKMGRSIEPHRLLIDAPPVGLEVQFNVEVYFPDQNRYLPLGEISPVVQTLAQRQFDHFVKQVRILIDPEYFSDLAKIPRLEESLRQLLLEVVSQEG